VLDEARIAGLDLVTLPDGLERVEPVERELAESSWGSPKDFSTWDAPGVAELAFTARAAELRTLRAAARPEAHDNPHAPALERAARELLALQASDWAFEAAHDAALAALRDSAPVPEPALRNLAPALDLAPLIAP
jgi:1,4-alpha-glucan branching enzyme